MSSIMRKGSKATIMFEGKLVLVVVKAWGVIGGTTIIKARAADGYYYEGPADMFTPVEEEEEDDE